MYEKNVVEGGNPAGTSLQKPRGREVKGCSGGVRMRCKNWLMKCVRNGIPPPINRYVGGAYGH